MLLPRISTHLRTSVLYLPKRSSHSSWQPWVTKRYTLYQAPQNMLRFHGRRFVTQTPNSPSPPLSMLKRVQKFIQENPYTKFSLALCAIVLGLSVSVELYNRFKKKKIPVVIVYPPRVGHYTIPRTDELMEIDRKLKSVRQREKHPILYVTGPKGAGKTELVCQYIQYFTESSSKWFGLRSVKPTVLYVNGSNKRMLELSLREAALSLGLKDSDISPPKSTTPETDIVEHTISAIQKKLEANKLPWLMVVDELDSSLGSVLRSAVSKLFVQHWRGTLGSVIVTATSSGLVMKDSGCMEIQPRMSNTDSLKVLSNLSGVHQLEQESTQPQHETELVEELQCSPLAVALAASTIKIYQSFLETDGMDSLSPIATYHDILKQALKDSKNVLDATLALYLEAAFSDPRLRHTFDLLGSCNLEYPIPGLLISQHLSDPFYEIPEESITLPASDPMEKLKELTGDLGGSGGDSYLAQLKNMLPFFGKKVPTPAEISQILASSEDRMSYLHDSPLLSFKAYKKSGFEFVEVHSCARKEIPLLFASKTAPMMDKNHVTREEEQFNQTAWFRKYRAFDRQNCLEKYHRSLPGISAPGVMTYDEYQKNPQAPLSDITIGTKLSDSSDYFEYQHLVSHYHRVVSSMSTLLKTCGGDIEDAQLRKYLQPHLEAASSYPLVSLADRAKCLYGLVSIESAFSPASEHILQKYKHVLSEQNQVFGSKSEFVARTLTDMADIKYSMNDTDGAKQLLEDSLEIYEKIPSRYASSEFPYDVGLALSSLAIVYSSLGDKEKCKDLLERALGAYQTMPSEGKVSKRQRKLVSHSLTDVAHAYLALGDLSMAKKYIDLSILAHQNLYLDAHSETVRTLNVCSIVYAMLGDKAESRRLRLEAGKVTAQLESQPLLV